MEVFDDQAEARPIVDDKPVKATIELPVPLHRDLVAYAAALGREQGQTIGDPTKLIVPMLERFIATDRGFARARRDGDQRLVRVDVRAHELLPGEPSVISLRERLYQRQQALEISDGAPLAGGQHHSGERRPRSGEKQCLAVRDGHARCLPW